MEESQTKESDHSAADYLKVARGMNLASDNIESYQFRMDEITCRSLSFILSRLVVFLLSPAIQDADCQIGMIVEEGAKYKKVMMSWVQHSRPY